MIDGLLSSLQTISKDLKCISKSGQSQRGTEMKSIEAELLLIYEGEGGGFSSLDSKEPLIRLEGRRTSLLLEKEEAWRLKSRALWLECGDDNTKFFHAYARGRKATNTIWSLQDEEGIHVDFEAKARCGVIHFQKLFKASPQASIEEVIRLSQMFPRFVDEEENGVLMKEVSEEELKEVMGSFQKDKIPGPDGWTIDFFWASLIFWGGTF